MPENNEGSKKITKLTPIKATAEMAEMAWENNSPLLANALLHEVEDLAHDVNKQTPPTENA